MEKLPGLDYVEAMKPDALSRLDPARPDSARRALLARLRASSVFRDYKKAFQTLTGLPLTLREQGSFREPMHGDTRSNRFCALLTTRNKTCSACLQLQESLETAAQNQTATVECFAGLHDSAVPVRLGDKVIGHLQTGQVLFDPPSDADFAAVRSFLQTLDPTLPSVEVEGLYRQSRVLDRSHYESVLRLLEIFAEHLSALANQLMVQGTHTENPAIAKARALITARSREELTLSDVARTVGMSPFHFCKRFKKATGLTFTEYLSRVRVESVKRLLLDPHKRVSEAAFEAGFQSLSQFNRVFSRIVGQSPSHFRNELHATSRGQPAPKALVFAA